MTQPLDFSAALRALKGGKRVARKDQKWQVGMEGTTILSMPTQQVTQEPYLYIEWPTYGGAYPQRSRVPWVAAQADLLAVDWEIVDEDK